MSTVNVLESDIISWVKKSVNLEGLNNFTINVQGTTEKGDGYTGEIVFVSVNGDTNENKKRVLNLVIKHGKSNDHLRKTMPIRKAFEIEMHIYDKVMPAFKKFQEEKGILDGFDNMARCYLTLMLEKMEVIVLENLRVAGYELHDKKQTLNVNHMKQILSKYGKLHALSFALRDQRKDEFAEITNGDVNMFNDFFNDLSVRKSYQKTMEELLTMFSERGDLDLYQKLKKVMAKDVADVLMDIRDEKEAQSVILHGDCWNNNFMFKYEDENKNSPSNVKILDWQLSQLLSPVIDLSYFIYINSSQSELDQLDELLETYYFSFSEFLRELGSKAEELFTFEDLKRHWNKYCAFGALFTPYVLKFVLCDKETAPAFEDLQEGQGIGAVIMDIHLSDMETYYKRAKAVLAHYFNNKY